jgi:hypothetical protein
MNAIYCQWRIHFYEGVTMQLTVRGVDDLLHNKLRQEARQRGLSVNRYVLQLLREGVGIKRSYGAADIEYHDLDHLFGTWSAEEVDEFERELAAQRQIDHDLWG